MCRISATQNEWQETSVRRVGEICKFAPCSSQPSSWLMRVARSLSGAINFNVSPYYWMPRSAGYPRNLFSSAMRGLDKLQTIKLILKFAFHIHLCNVVKISWSKSQVKRRTHLPFLTLWFLVSIVNVLWDSQINHTLTAVAVLLIGRLLGFPSREVGFVHKYSLEPTMLTRTWSSASRPL